MSRKGNTLTFRLRKTDADLSLAIDRLDSSVLSELCRDGLRLMLGIKTTRQTQVVERPIVPAVIAKIGSSQQAKPFVPKGERKA